MKIDKHDILIYGSKGILRCRKVPHIRILFALLKEKYYTKVNYLDLISPRTEKSIF